ncbi:metallophosphoesterase family protein [Lacimicrobium alkaliphilum]|nr:metallophosphoesterase [Lacimicrobium alkaliphilum]
MLPDTQGGTDAQGQAHVAMHPMREVLKHQAAAEVDLVIALGDLTDHGSTLEFSEWTSIASQYQDQGIEFLPVMGNHEHSFAYAVEWIDTMKQYIPEDAVHMPGSEWVNYYIVRDNVLIFGLAYYNLPLAFQWIKDTVSSMEEEIEHIVVASHDGLIGAKYGQTREQIVDGTKDDGWVYDVQPEIRKFFSDHDVIYVQGHEHQYQRSLVTAKTTLQTLPSSATPTGGNYRMGAYTQIMAGNASYKGYEFRYGERELVQMIVSQKNATYSEGNGSDHFDVNSSILTFNGPRIDYQSYYAEHRAKSNAPEFAFDAQWHLMDKFSRSLNRCETMVYPNSVLDETRPVLVFQNQYMSNDCYADDGSFARLAGGINNTFNRTDSRTRDMGFTPGISRAESLNDLMRLAYQWLYIPHERWNPNLNSPLRVVPDYENDELLIPETTIDLKEHVTLSWLQSTEQTQTDILIVSGTQNQTGIYQGAYGGRKDIQQDNGLPMSQTDGNAKAPVQLPQAATQSWDISDAQADSYAIQFTGPEALEPQDLILASRSAEGDWQALTPEECIVEMGWTDDLLSAPPARPDGCGDTPLVGLDTTYGNRWWVVLNRDAELALISR